MQSPFIYHPRFLQNDYEDIYNNFLIPNKNISRPSNYNNYLFSQKENRINNKSYKFLTEKNISSTNKGFANKLLIKGEVVKSFQSSKNHYKQFNYLPKTNKKIESNNKNLNIKNDLISANNATYISLYNRKENIDLNSNNIYNLYVKGIKKNKTNNNIFIQNFSSLVIDNYNQKKLLDSSLSCNIKHDSYSRQYQSLMKHKSNILLAKNNNKINNSSLNNGNNRKNEYEEKSSFNKINKDINYEIKPYIKEVFNTIKEEKKKNLNDFNSLTDRLKYDDGLKRNMTVNYIDNDFNDNLKKIVKNIKKPNNNDLNKKESKTNNGYKNKNIEPSKIENFGIRNAIIKKENENNKKKNFLNNLPNWKESDDNKNNNSFNEIKSISKEPKSQKKLIINSKINFVVDKSDLKFKKKNSNIDETIKMKDKIDSNSKKVILKERQNFTINNETSKIITENINKSAKNIKSKLQKKNYNNIKQNVNKNNFAINGKIKTVSLNNNFLIKKIAINKNINYFIDTNNCNMENKSSPQSENYSKYPNIIDTLKIYSIYFTYFSIRKNNNLKSKKNQKFKKCNSKTNIMLLFNINNKTFEEDFLLNKKDNKNNIKKTLIPQISFRITLFGKKESKIGKYYIVNKFYSQNIRDKPVELESDF